MTQLTSALFLTFAGISPAFAYGYATAEPYYVSCSIDGNDQSGRNTSEQGQADEIARLIERNKKDGYPEVVSINYYADKTDGVPGSVLHYCVTSRRAH